MADIAAALQDIADIGVHPSLALKPLQPKQDLLQWLLANEQTRLLVWLFPRDHGERHHFIKFGQKGRGLSEVDFSSEAAVRLMLTAPGVHISLTRNSVDGKSVHCRQYADAFSIADT